MSYASHRRCSAFPANHPPHPTLAPYAASRFNGWLNCTRLWNGFGGNEHACTQHGQVVQVCGRTGSDSQPSYMTYLNQCLAECADAAPANGVQWEQGIPCEQDIKEADAKCKLLDNKRVVRSVSSLVMAFFSFGKITSVATLPQS